MKYEFLIDVASSVLHMCVEVATIFLKKENQSTLKITRLIVAMLHSPYLYCYSYLIY